MKAKLSTANKADYFVYWRDGTGRLHKKRAGMNRIRSLRDRKAFGLQLCQRVNEYLSTGLLKQPSAVSVLREIADMKKGTLRHRSWQSYKYAINKFEKWLPDPDMPITEVTRQVAREFIDSLLKQGYGGYSINGMQGFLSALFGMYGERNENYVNPFRGIRKVEQGIGRNLAFSESQKEELWSWMDSPMQMFTKFIYYTYLRPLELLRLRVRDIQPQTGRIIIQGHQSKNKKQQSVQIPDSFIDQVRSMGYDSLPGDWYLFGRGLVPGVTQLSRNQVSKLHGRILRALKYPDQYTLYSWKHTGVVAAYRSGIEIYAIMRQLRHHSLDMTQIYLKTLGLEENTEFRTKMV